MPKETFFNLQEEKREKIINEAIKEFAYKGFEKGNISEIAKNSDISKGSVYQYFNDKEDLYIHCIKTAYEIAASYINEKIDIYSMNITDYIYYAFKFGWPLLNEKKDIYFLLQNMYTAEKNAVKNSAMAFILDNAEHLVLELIKNGKEKGTIRRDISDHSLLLYIEGISVKFKEYMAEHATKQGKNMCDFDFEHYEGIVKDLIKLLKTGLEES